jgi:hypothetical protein
MFGIRNPPPPCNDGFNSLANKINNLKKGFAYRISPSKSGDDEPECLASALGMYQVDLDKWFHTEPLSYYNGSKVCPKRDSVLAQVLALTVATRHFRAGKWLYIGEFK